MSTPGANGQQEFEGYYEITIQVHRVDHPEHGARHTSAVKTRLLEGDAVVAGAQMLLRSVRILAEEDPQGALDAGRYPALRGQIERLEEKPPAVYMECKACVARGTKLGLSPTDAAAASRFLVTDEETVRGHMRSHQEETGHNDWITVTAEEI